jgi:hypothetical protein
VSARYQLPLGVIILLSVSTSSTTAEYGLSPLTGFTGNIDYAVLYAGESWKFL